MKKVLVVLGVLALLLCGCGEKTQDENGKNKIGAIQLVEHPALDEATKGFYDGLAENGYVEGENVEIDFQSAQGQTDTCETIANKFVNASVDLIFANATPAAQAVAQKTTDIPIVVTSVTDPATSGLVESNEMPNTNVTGSSDLNPVNEQVELIQTMFPETKTVAVMYCSSEDNSIFQYELAKKAIEAHGMTCVAATVADLSSITPVAESLVGKVDAIYIGTDNLLAANMPSVAQVTNENKIPVFCGEEGMCSSGGFATYSLSYYNLGKLAGKMAADILNGADPATMPIGYLASEDLELIINKTTADAIGYEIPEELAAIAKIIE